MPLYALYSQIGTLISYLRGNTPETYFNALKPITMRFFRKKENLEPAIKDMVRKFITDEGLSFLKLGFHHVKINDTKECLIITLYLVKPDMLIGRKGERIGRLSSAIGFGLDRKVRMEAKFFNAWD